MDASADTIVSTTYCADTIPELHVLVDYGVVEFANGNVFANGSISDANGEASNAMYYSPAESGYDSAQIVALLDEVPPSDGGYWIVTMDRTTLVVTATYHDADIDAGVMSWAFPAEHCTRNTYP